MAPKGLGGKMAKVPVRKGLSIDEIKENLNKGNGGGASKVMLMLSNEDVASLRILDDPDEWTFYDEHYTRSDGFQPCIGEDDGCAFCEEGERASTRALVNVYVYKVDRAANGKFKAREEKIAGVRLLKLNRDFQTVLLGQASRKGTLKKYDAEITRDGAGTETVYSVSLDRQTSDGPRIKKTDLIDATEYLSSIVDAFYGNKKGGKKKSKKNDDDEPKAKKSTKPKRPSPWDEDEDEAEEDEEEEESDVDDFDEFEKATKSKVRSKR
jgi:hypothetical protein